MKLTVRMQHLPMPIKLVPVGRAARIALLYVTQVLGSSV